jgi:hypothetical protein
MNPKTRLVEIFRARPPSTPFLRFGLTVAREPCTEGQGFGVPSA